jgi:hypothetical protein
VIFPVRDIPPPPSFRVLCTAQRTKHGSSSKQQRSETKEMAQTLSTSPRRRRLSTRMAMACDNRYWHILLLLHPHQYYHRPHLQSQLVCGGCCVLDYYSTVLYYRYTFVYKCCASRSISNTQQLGYAENISTTTFNLVRIYTTVVCCVWVYSRSR